MNSAIMLPKNKSIQNLQRVGRPIKDINSYSAIGENVDLGSRDSVIRSAGYAIDIKKIWKDL